MNYFGAEVQITGEVQYIGEGEDPKDNVGFQIWAKAFKEVYGQPERLNPEDVKSVCDSLNTTNK